MPRSAVGELVLVRTERQLCNWFKSKGLGPFWGSVKDRVEDQLEASAAEVKEVRRRYIQNYGPGAYPCLAMMVCVSCGYEEFEPFYLYATDVAQFNRQLANGSVS